MKKIVFFLALMILTSVILLSYPAEQKQYHESSTGLTWQYCRSTQYRRCPEPMLLNWGLALRYCASLRWGGLKGWRLPNRTELISLINWQKRTPAISNPLAIDTKDNVYWSATTYRELPEKAYYTSFFSGLSYANSKQLHAYVRCVR